MTETLKAVSLCSASLGAWTLLSLLLSRRGEAALRHALAALVGLLLLPPLRLYLELARGTAWPPLEVWSHSLTWAYGPLLVRCLGLALLWPPGRWRSRWHAAPLALAFAAGALGVDWVQWPAAVTLLALQTLAYGGWAAHAAWRERTRLRQLATGHPNSRAHWLLFLSCGLIAVSLWDLALFAAAQAGALPSSHVLGAAALGVALYVDVIALLALNPPDWLDRALPEQPTPTPAEPAAAAPRAVELSADAARELAQRLLHLRDAQAPHRDPDISLPRLAALMDVTPHQLSELLNLHLGSSFYDYLNDCRHTEALQLLEQGSAELTVADIAYRAGFNNRNSFYKVFKDKTGTTPSEYRRRHQRRA